MVIFREHRCYLEDSMKTVVEVESLDQLRKHIYKVIPECRGAIIEVKEYAYDDRIKWNTFLVTVDGRAVGFTNGELK